MFLLKEKNNNYYTGFYQRKNNENNLGLYKRRKSGQKCWKMKEDQTFSKNIFVKFMSRHN